MARGALNTMSSKKASKGMIAGLLPDEMTATIRSLVTTENLYLSATREVATKLKNLNDEFNYTKDRNRST